MSRLTTIVTLNNSLTDESRSGTGYIRICHGCKHEIWSLVVVDDDNPDDVRCYHPRCAETAAQIHELVW